MTKRESISISGAEDQILSTTYACNGLDFVETTYPREYRNPSHAHSEAQLIFLMAGTVLDTRPRQSLLREPATLIFLPAGEPHATHSHAGFQTFHMGITPQWLERVRQYTAFGDSPVTYRAPLPLQLAARLHREFLRQDNLTPLMLEGLTLELIGEMARQAPASMESCHPRWLSRVEELLHARFTENLSLQELAEAAGVHPTHLTRVFREKHRRTIGDYLRELRLEQACHELTTSPLTLAEIAAMLGFYDQSHFSTLFKRHTGLTPGEFRKKALLR
ncbi:MAG TPA: AraC family transcriptional regulator [Chthonomonadaceae bacterium]|nr:AraC family transcriptional regulator [Chthonomonadaceae bacterium]